jgi:tetratricopeptide (TPR) repeat protein
VPIPPELEEPPGEPDLDPPVEPAADALPVAQLAWEKFEKLILALAGRESGVEHAQRFGTPGQDQSGIDIYARRREEPYVVYQCRRVEALAAGDLKKAVDGFLDGEWAAKSSEFVFSTTFSAVERKLAKAVEAQALRLREAGIGFTIWDAEVLSDKLRAYPDLVERFFGDGWLRAFLPGVAVAKIDARLANIEQALSRSERVEILIFDWDPKQARDELKELKDEDPELFRKVEDRIGNPPQADRVVNLISERPEWLAGPSIRPWRILALLAEEAGNWIPSSDAWIETANRAEGYERAGLLVAAAVTVSIEGDTTKHDELLAAARDLAPEHPRVRLQDVDQSLGGRQRLESLEGVESDDPPVAALIAGHRALAHLLLGEIDRASEFQREAEGLNPKAAIVRMTGINVTVQQAREDTVEHRRLDYPGLKRAYNEAMNVLDELRRRRRHQESVRMLMLAADIQSMIGEPERALSLLRSSTEEERAVADAGEVLGDAAIRAAGWREVIDLTDKANPSEMIDRIRATAFLQVGTPPQRAEAIETLDRLIEENGEDAPLAAISRLGFVMGKQASWSEPAAIVLRDRGFERGATIAKAFSLQAERDSSGAVGLLDARDETWALLAKLRLADMRRDEATMQKVASTLLDRSPAQDVVIECGRALGLVGEIERARTVLESVGRDETCPPAWRADAYALFVGLLLDAGDWGAAKTAHDDWMSVRPQDTRGQSLAPMIASRARS